MSQLTVQQAFDLALQHHSAKRLPEAETFYREVLNLNPQHIPAMHNLGLIAHEMNHSEAAVTILREVVARRPRNAEAHNSLGIALRGAGKFDEAIAACRQSIALNPGDPKPYYNMGNALSDKAQFDEAISAYREAIARNPNYAEAHDHLGLALGSKGLWDQAIIAHLRSIELDPKMHEPHNNLGNALSAKGQLAEAKTALQRAIHLKPDYSAAHNNLGVVLKANGQLSEALAAFEHALLLVPNHSAVHNNFGAALVKNGQVREAIASFRKSIALNSRYAEAYSNLGAALLDIGELEECITALRFAVEVNPKYAGAINNLGVALTKYAKFEEAMECYRKAIALEPGYADAHYNFGLALLIFGNFEQGWEEYEWRIISATFETSQRKFSQPQWDGRPLEGRTLLLHAEQGLGDTLQFVRYAPLIAAGAGRVIFESPPEVYDLLRMNAKNFEVICRDQPLPTFDVHCSVLSLPFAFKTTLASVPNDVPYFHPDNERVQAWRSRLSAAPTGLNVGLVWAGNPNHKNDRERTVPLERLAPLGNVPGVNFFSLQKGAAQGQADSPPAGLHLINVASELHDFADTAAAISLMDLVICVDTSVAHLAGAMGKPVWVMVQFSPDWRWLLDREDSPWYPSMRLFRQSVMGDWGSVVARLADALARLIEAPR